MRRILLALMILFLTLAATVAAAPELSISPLELELCNKDASAELTLSAIANPHNSSLSNLTVWLETESTAALWEGSTVLHVGDLAPGATAFDHTWELLCDEGEPGSHTILIKYSAELEGTPEQGSALISGEDAYIDILITPAAPVITSFSVAGLTADGNIFRSPESTVELNAKTDEEATCRLGTADLTYDELASVMTADGNEHTLTLAFEEGVHTLYARCKDIAGNEMASPSKLALIVDETAPTITITRPGAWEPTTSFPLEVTTSEQAECRHSFILESHESMSSLTASGLAHSDTLELAEGVYSLYVSCIDQAGNPSRKVTTVTVDIPPTATISLGDDTLKPGLYRLNITASEPLLTTPTLSYTLSGIAASNSISLEGSGTSWGGYLLIADTGSEHVGTFSFKGTNSNGRIGTEITEGKLFLVDAKAPEPPTGLDAALENTTLILVWRHDSESVERFSVYGSTSPFVGYADFLTSLHGKRYTLPIPSEGTFYFRLAAIDESGNEGELSKELTVKLSATPDRWIVQSWTPGEEEVLTTPSTPSQPSQIEDITLTSLRQEVSSLLLDVRSAQNLLTTSIDEFEGLASLNLNAQLTSAITELVTMEDEITTLLSSGGSSPDQLRLYKLRIARLKKNTPKVASVHDRLNIEHSIQQDALEQLIRETLLTPAKSTAALTITAAAIGVPSGSAEAQEAFEERYLSALSTLHGQLRISRTTESFDIEYLDGSIESKTLLIDEITGIEVLPTPEEGDEGALPEGINPQVFISLPKSVSSDASELDILTEGYEIIEQDPVIAFPLSTRKIEIILPGRVSESKTRQIATFLAYEPEQFSRAVADSGMSWKVEKELFSAFRGMALENIILFIGLALVLGMAGYYVYLTAGHKLQALIPKRERSIRYEEQDLEVREHFSRPQQARTVVTGRTSGEQIESSLRELERLSGDLVTDEDNLTKDDMEKLHDLEMVKALIKEAEEAKLSGDIEMVRMLYRDLGKRYAGLSPRYKERVSERCITLHTWLRQNSTQKQEKVNTHG